MVFLGINVVIIYPEVSIPKDKGLTSNNKISYTLLPPLSHIIEAYMAAP